MRQSDAARERIIFDTFFGDVIIGFRSEIQFYVYVITYFKKKFKSRKYLKFGKKAYVIFDFSIYSPKKNASKLFF